MKLTFYGVRGSIPSPGVKTTKYGGNTPCTLLSSTDDCHIILDAGTGIIALGDLLIQDNKPIYILLSHNHWDHIQGFPFFRPAYQAGREINIIAANTKPYQPDAILQQMSGSYFPIIAEQLQANIKIIDYRAHFSLLNLKVECLALNHPSSGCGYLFDDGQFKLAYVTDNEIYAEQHLYTQLAQWHKFLDQADLLIHDAQYIPQDFPSKTDWGHSNYLDVLQLALKTQVRNLCLFSHDHRRTDQDVDHILGKSRDFVTQNNSNLHVFAAREGCGFTLNG